ncbi:MAG: hypothetical protein IPP55_14585 [Anaerolineales bacterium]|nr:hypothetical protein [Anaerolineales bacterium]MBP7346588.1 hypothetical protein [Sediminibacterium sp.]
MATLRNLTIVVEHTGKKIPVNEVDGNMTATDLLNALAGKINLPEGTRGVITRKRTHKQILPTQTLEGAGVESDDTLLADFDRTAG